VGMSNEQVESERLGRGAHELHAEVTGAGSAVQNNDRTVTGTYFDTRRVAAVLRSAKSRYGNGAARSPETYVHRRVRFKP